jgi:hypothetical protein
MNQQRRDISPMIVAVEMGYGHLRPAHALAEAFGAEVIRLDLPPMAGPVETVLWRTVRTIYNGLSRACDWPTTGLAAKLILESITGISPLQNHAYREPATMVARLADGLAGTLIGRRFRSMASEAEKPIVIATYPVAAMAARHAPGTRVYCLATDTDLNRAWAPANASEAEIRYFAPVERVAERLRSFGVPNQRIHLTGFPLPANLIRQALPVLARRLHRLDPNCRFRKQAYREIAALEPHSSEPFSLRPISMTVAIGGAGAQIRQAGQVVKSLKNQVLEGRLSLTLVAGIRPGVAAVLREMIQSAGMSSCIGKGIKILLAKDLEDYFRRFNDCLAKTDVLWTKPSELVFYAALGLPILLADPVGGQEHANRNWLLSMNAGLDAGDPAQLDQRLENLLAEGDLCRIACNAYLHIERNGLARIVELIKNKNATDSTDG